MKEQFGGIERLYETAGLARIQQAHVAIIGVGGVGCWAAEMLARAGVGQLTLIDADEVCVTNINRQVHALNSSVGRAKVLVMAERIKDINSDCEVHAIEQFYMDSTADELLNNKYSYVIDAIDSVKHKVALLADCKKRQLSVVTTGGAGGKKDPTRLKQTDLAQTQGDRLLKKVRYQLRRHYDFKDVKKFGIQAIYSDEEMKLPFCEVDEKKSFRLDCDTGYGTSPTVISCFGILAADAVISALIKP